MLAKIKFYLLYKVFGFFKLNFLPSFYSSHSQFGEDMLLRGVFGEKNDGFYLDIGAHHPIYFSNTYHFYQKGWRGINVEAAPEVISLFNFIRPNDINLNSCIGENTGDTVTFYEFDQAALNTTLKEVADECVKKGFPLKRERKMKTENINDVLREKIPSGKSIDFLSIDIEGLDELVLKTLDFKEYSPKAIMIEDHNFKMEVPRSNIMAYLIDKGYQLEGKCGPSLLFLKKEA